MLVQTWESKSPQIKRMNKSWIKINETIFFCSVFASLQYGY